MGKTDPVKPQNGTCGGFARQGGKRPTKAPKWQAAACVKEAFWRRKTEAGESRGVPRPASAYTNARSADVSGVFRRGFQNAVFRAKGVTEPGKSLFPRAFRGVPPRMKEVYTIGKKQGKIRALADAGGKKDD